MGTEIEKQIVESEIKERTNYNRLICIANVNNVPDIIAIGLCNYIVYRKPVGGFLIKVLSNDLFGALGAADHINSKAMKEICSFIYSYAPSACYGSLDKVAAWLKH